MASEALIAQRPLFNSSRYPNSVKWSDDDQIAVAAGNTVVILHAATLGGNYCHAAKTTFEPVPLPTMPHPQCDSAAFTMHALRHMRFNLFEKTKGPPSIRSVDWSPAGMAGSGGCLLASISEDHQVMVHEACSTQTCDSVWQPCVNITAATLLYLLQHNMQLTELESDVLRLRGGTDKPSAKRRKTMATSPANTRARKAAGKIKEEASAVNSVPDVEGPSTNNAEAAVEEEQTTIATPKRASSSKRKPMSEQYVVPEDFDAASLPFIDTSTPAAFKNDLPIKTFTHFQAMREKVPLEELPKYTRHMRLYDIDAHLLQRTLAEIAHVHGARMAQQGLEEKWLEKLLRLHIRRRLVDVDVGGTPASPSLAAGTSSQQQQPDESQQNDTSTTADNSTKALKRSRNGTEPDDEVYVVPEDFDPSVLPQPNATLSAAKLRIDLPIKVAQRFQMLRDEFAPHQLPQYKPRQHLLPFDRQLLQRCVAEYVAAYAAMLETTGLTAETLFAAVRKLVRVAIIDAIDAPAGDEEAEQATASTSKQIAPQQQQQQQAAHGAGATGRSRRSSAASARDRMTAMYTQVEDDDDADAAAVQTTADDRNRKRKRRDSGAVSMADGSDDDVVCDVTAHAESSDDDDGDGMLDVIAEDEEENNVEDEDGVKAMDLDDEDIMMDRPSQSQKAARRSSAARSSVSTAHRRRSILRTIATDPEVAAALPATMPSIAPFVKRDTRPSAIAEIMRFRNDALQLFTPPGTTTVEPLKYGMELDMVSMLCCAWSPAFIHTTADGTAGASSVRMSVLAVGTKAGHVWLWRCTRKPPYTPQTRASESDFALAAILPPASKPASFVTALSFSHLACTGDSNTQMELADSTPSNAASQQRCLSGDAVVLLCAGHADGSVVLWGGAWAWMACAPAKFDSSGLRPGAQGAHFGSRGEGGDDARPRGRAHVMQRLRNILPCDMIPVTCMSASMCAAYDHGSTQHGDGGPCLTVAVGKHAGTMAVWQSSGMPHSSRSSVGSILQHLSSSCCAGGSNGSNDVTHAVVQHGVHDGWAVVGIAIHPWSHTIITCPHIGEPGCWRIDMTKCELLACAAPQCIDYLRKPHAAAAKRYGIAIAATGLHCAIAMDGVGKSGQASNAWNKMQAGQLSLYRTHDIGVATTNSNGVAVNHGVAGFQQSLMACGDAVRCAVNHACAAKVAPAVAAWDIAMAMLRHARAVNLQNIAQHVEEMMQCLDAHASAARKYSAQLADDHAMSSQHAAAWRAMQLQYMVTHLVLRVVESSQQPEYAAQLGVQLQQMELQLLQRYVLSMLRGFIASHSTHGSSQQHAQADSNDAVLSSLLMSDWIEMSAATTQSLWPALRQLPSQVYALAKAAPCQDGVAPARETSEMAGARVSISCGGVHGATVAVVAIPETNDILSLPRCSATFRLCDDQHAWRCTLCNRPYMANPSSVFRPDTADKAVTGKTELPLDAESCPAPPCCVFCGLRLAPNAMIQYTQSPYFGTE